MTVCRKTARVWVEHGLVRGQQLRWEMSQAVLDGLDTRVMQLAASTTSGSDFVRKGMRPVRWTGSAKCADLSKITEDGPGDYIFTESLPEDIAPGVAHLLKLLRVLKSASCDVNDDDAEATLAATKEQVVVLVCQIERSFPRTEMCRVLHVVLHVCDMVRRWNNVRNFWCFLTERFNPTPSLQILVVDMTADITAHNRRAHLGSWDG
jgi:hypothetical protein